MSPVRVCQWRPPPGEAVAVRRLKGARLRKNRDPFRQPCGRHFPLKGTALKRRHPRHTLTLMLSLHPVAGGFLRGHSHECPLKSFGVGFQRERGIETPLPLAVFCILFWRQKSMPAELSRLKTICIEIEWLLCFAPDFSHTSSIIFKFICLRRHTFLFRKRKVWKRDRHGAGFRFPAPLEPPPNGQRGARAAAPLETQSHEDWKASGNGGCYRCWCWLAQMDIWI